MKRILIYIFLFVLLGYVGLWLFSIPTYKVKFGLSFSQRYAESLGLDWKETYEEILSDLQPKYLRISANWNDVEKEKGVFSYDETDYLLNTAGNENIKVILVIGEKTPRWPECHVPPWANELETIARTDALLSYVKNTVLRYKDHPSVELWQVENEPFIKFDFGLCEKFDMNAVKDEVDLVRDLDSKHPILITDSGELSTWYKATRAGDIFGTTVYRIVRSPNGNRFSYSWVPPALYKIHARLLGKSFDTFFISELQGEPWFSGNPVSTPLHVGEETMDPKRLESNISFTTHVGASRSYLWGAEWWYWMKKKKNDSQYWEIAKKVLAQ